MTESVKDFDFIPEISFSDKEMNIMAFSDGFLSLYNKERNLINDENINQMYYTVSRVAKIVGEVLFFDIQNATLSLKNIKKLLIADNGDVPINSIIENGFKNIDTQKYLDNMIYIEKNYPDVAKAISCNIASASHIVNENINNMNTQSKLSR